MREYIYRIWNKKEKRYIMTASLYGCEGIAHLSQAFNREEVDIEEYTGLNDIKGNKIFENDIIDFICRHKQVEQASVVYYSGSYGCFINDNGFREFLLLSDIVNQYYPKIAATIHDDDLVP